METKGQRIQRLRKAKKLSQAAVAKEVGVSRVSVTKWESGNTKNLVPEHLFKLARLLGVSAEMLDTGKYVRDPAPSSVVQLGAAERQALRYQSKLLDELMHIADGISDAGLQRLIERAAVLRADFPRVIANEVN